jgi:hypothetical protein
VNRHNRRRAEDFKSGPDDGPRPTDKGTGPKGTLTNESPSMTPPPDQSTLLEQRLSYRVRAWIADGRSTDTEFTLPGLRGWMLCQTWPFPAPSAWLECLAVLSWSAICVIDTDPDQELVVRTEFARQLEYLDGTSIRRPVSLDAFRLEQTRIDLYTSLRKAAEPGSSRREFFGLPRFNSADRLAR